MADMIQSGAEWLAGVHKAHAARSVYYSRGAESLAVLATVSNMPMSVTDDYGNVRIVRDVRSFVIDAAELVLGGVQAVPQTGDRISETLNGITRVYEVMPPESGEAPWRWADASLVRRHIHTKEVVGG